MLYRNAKDVFITTEYFDGDAQGLIDYIDEGVTKYGYSIQEIWKLATNVYGETLFNIHNGATGLDSESINKWESSNRQNDRTLQGNEDGNGASKGSSKTDKKISFSLKEWENPTSNPDIRFSLKDNATYTLSDGQVKKKVANFTKLKVYSKVEAESIINSILETNFNLEDYSVRISGKTKAEAIAFLNTI